ncbi:MAG: DUF1345 domain-containing protein [Mycobacteriales bacterium]
MLSRRRSVQSPASSSPWSPPGRSRFSSAGTPRLSVCWPGCGSRSGQLSAAATKAHAAREDPSIRMSELIVLAAGVALLAAVGLVLIRACHAMGATKAYLIALGVVSVALSWALVHTLFTLRYARTYYEKPEGGINFNETDPPTYLDFAYVELTIGMTFQVSDTNLGSKPIRRIALTHAALSYLFGAVIVALAINVVASLLH